MSRSVAYLRIQSACLARILRVLARASGPSRIWTSLMSAAVNRSSVCGANRQAPGTGDWPVLQCEGVSQTFD